jgi:hypothetical protein
MVLVLMGNVIAPLVMVENIAKRRHVLITVLVMGLVKITNASVKKISLELIVL